MKRINQSLVGFLFAVTMTVYLPARAVTNLIPVDLKSASHFALLSGTAITATGGGIIHGDVGASPITGAAITGLATTQVSGIIYTVDGFGPVNSVMDADLLMAAKNDLVLAYDDTAGRSPVVLVAGGALAGTRAPGVYKDDAAPASLGLTGILTLDALGDPDAVWIFQSASTLIAEVDSLVVLTNEALASHVFWQVGSSATLKTGASFKGSILALESITMDAGVVLEGRALARNAAITFNGDIVNLPAPESPVFTDIHRSDGDATVVALTTTPFFNLSLQTSSNLLRTNWHTIMMDIPEASPCVYTDNTATANVTLRFYRAFISY